MQASHGRGNNWGTTEPVRCDNKLLEAERSQHEKTQGLLLDRRPSFSKDQFVSLMNTKSCRLPEIGIFINKSESKGFVHQNHMSDLCSEKTAISHNLRYTRHFQLLQEYMDIVLTSKMLTSELETLQEQCYEDKQTSALTTWDISKVANIFERYKADAKVIRALEVRLRSFLKTEMAFLAHFVLPNLEGLQKCLYCVQNELIMNIQYILEKELPNLHLCGSDILQRSDSLERSNLRNLFELFRKFQETVLDIATEFDKWRSAWRSSTLGFVSKCGGLRKLLPFLHLQHSPLPHKTNNLDKFIKPTTDSFELVARKRSQNVAKEVVSRLFRLVFDEKNSTLHLKRNGLLQSSEHEHNADKKSTTRKNKSSIRTIRNTVFQEFLMIASQEETVLRDIIDDLLFIHSNISNSNIDIESTNKGTAIFVKSELNELQKNGPILSLGKSLVLAKNFNSDDRKKRKNLVENYVGLIWKELPVSFLETVFSGRINDEGLSKVVDLPLVCIDGESLSIMTSCLMVKKLKSFPGGIQPLFMDCVKSISSRVRFQVNLQKWDYAFCSAQVQSSKDKCRLNENTTTPKHSETMGLVLRCLNVIQDTIDLCTANNGSLTASLLTELKNQTNWSLPKCLISLIATLQLGIHWLQTKSQQFMASGSWQQFHLITNDDAQVLQDKLRSMTPNLTVLLKNIHFCELPDDSLILNLDMIQKLVSEIKMLNSNRVANLVHAVECRMKSTIALNFPPAKQWRKRGATRTPVDANLYVKLTSHRVLVPVISSLKYVRVEDVKDILFKCCAAFVTSIMDFILEEGIKFSSYGVHQLQLDLICFKEWIAQDAFDIPPETVSEIITLQPFCDMEAAITLLSCQPEHKNRSKSDEQDHGSSMATSSSTGSLGGSVYDDAIRDVELVNKEQWLSLRVKRGQQRSKLMCISLP